VEIQIAALADPTRRAILDLLREGPQPVCRLAAGLPVSRPAVSQHLRVLTEAGLAQVTPVGNRRVYAIVPGGAQALRDWLDVMWDDALAAFAAAARDEARAAAWTEAGTAEGQRR
jgi:DNA-binding transcriptional ArsR family regulator